MIYAEDRHHVMTLMAVQGDRQKKEYCCIGQNLSRRIGASSPMVSFPRNAKGKNGNKTQAKRITIRGLQAIHSPEHNISIHWISSNHACNEDDSWPEIALEEIISLLTSANTQYYTLVASLAFYLLRKNDIHL